MILLADTPASRAPFINHVLVTIALPTTSQKIFRLPLPRQESVPTRMKGDELVPFPLIIVELAIIIEIKKERGVAYIYNRV